MDHKHDLLILDYGGVYSFEYEPEDQARIIRTLFGKDFDIAPKSERSRLGHQFACGKISTKQYIEKLSGLLDTSRQPSVELFENMWLEPTLPPSPPMVELVKSARASGIQTALLSDLYAFEARLARKWGRYEGFDKVFLSPEEGMTKREPRFFKYVLKHFKVTSEKALFVGDAKHNIDVAQSLGIDTLLVDKETYASAAELVSKILQLV